MNWIELNKGNSVLSIVIIVNWEDYLEEIKKKANELINEIPNLSLVIEGVWNDKSIENYAMAKNRAIRLVDSKYISFIKDEEFINNHYEKEWLKTIANCKDLTEIELEPVKKYSFERMIMFNASNLAAMVTKLDSVRRIGGFNEMLDSADDYELALRLKEYSPFLDKDAFLAKFTEFENKAVFQEDFVAYAYILSRYKKKLESVKLWEQAFLRKVKWAINFEQGKNFEKYFYEFLLDEHKFYREMYLKDPVIIVIDEDSACLDLMKSFSEMFYKACQYKLRAAFCFSNKDKEFLKEAKNMNIAAVIGFQSEIFADLKSNEPNINDIDCPKFIDIFDHPLYISYFLMFPVKKFYCLSCDGDYARNAAKIFSSVKNGYRWFPAGIEAKSFSELSIREKKNYKKEFDLSFLANFTDYRIFMEDLYKLPNEERVIANKMLEILKKNTDYSFEKAYKRAIDEIFRDDEYSHEIYKDRKQTLVTMHHMWPVARIVTAFFREKVIRSILDSGLELHVFGDSWRSPSFKDYDNLIIHDSLSYYDGLEVYAKSKISLNVFSWHKDCLTERILNAMFNMSLSISDKSKGLLDSFKDGEDLVVYELDKLDDLPDMIRYYLNNDEAREKIINQAYENVLLNHSWEKRVDELDDIIRDVYDLEFERSVI